MATLSLIFGVHCHLPVGTPEAEVLSRIDECYLPVLTRLAGSRIKFCLHVSGVLLKPIESRRPGMLELIRQGADRGQIELIGGGIYEPYLSTLTEPDRVGQVRRYSDYLHRLTAMRPKGYWPAGQAWESHLCKPLQEAGIQYAFLDDSYFAGAGVGLEHIHGYYVTEESGHRILVFPIDEVLRFSMVRKTPLDTIDYLAHLAEDVGDDAADRGRQTVVTVMDDAECFSGPRGINWVDGFLSQMEKSNWIQTLTPSEWISAHPARGLLYLPPTSPADLSEQALSGKIQAEYAVFKRIVERQTETSSQRLFLRSGYWKSFLTKFPESNWMQKRVLFAAQKMGSVLEKLGADREARTIRDLLDQAACHDAYGVATGADSRLLALRLAIFERLIEAETRFSKKMGLFPTCYTEDIDMDGLQEMLIYTDHWVIGLKPDEGGRFIEWSYRPAKYNFQNTFGGRSSGLLHTIDPAVTLDQWIQRRLRPDEGLPGGAWVKGEIRDKAESFEIDFDRKTERGHFKKRVSISKHENKLILQAQIDPPGGGGADPAGRATPACAAMGFEMYYADANSLEILGPAASATGLRDGGMESSGGEVAVTDRSRGTRVVFKTGPANRFFIGPSYYFIKTESSMERLFQGMALLILAPQAAPQFSVTLEVNSLAGT